MNQEIFLKDYEQPGYWAESVDLVFDIKKDKTTVEASTLFKKNKNNNIHAVELNGVDLKLISIKVNGEALKKDDYILSDDLLKLESKQEEFLLDVIVEIDPINNHSCEGLYQSGHILCTQNEAQGFRKITYFQDRPDVMSRYKTKIIADKKEYPFLLANGNKVENGELDNGRHFCTWEDPHYKPCYLFALVAGDLALVSDTFTTCENREVALEIYVDKGNEDKCFHAMQSLKDSMKWDEDVFGLAYDLDVYMIVAVDSFNMGAMENKGLNIFNSAYVLAKKETATDANFQGIQSVIGHEYFHNWTGNRVTCRDWFQLTLKEGLTVFRDQEFSSDMLSRGVKRIEDVRMLKQHQFLEDAGPTSHPIQPKSYIEINNFYTATIYEKGAEVIRMIHTLIGKDNFRKGMDLYFQRHDGQAVTTQDFVSAMSDASGFDLEHFSVWYDQNGTPELSINLEYDENNKSVKIVLKQTSNTNNSKFNYLAFPFHYSLYKENGEKFDLPNDGKIVIDKEELTLVINEIESLPIPSFNENFTAPIKLDYEYSETDLMFLMKYDQDEFNRYDACQRIYTSNIHKMIQALKEKKYYKISSHFIDAFKTILMDQNLDNSFKALAISFINLKEFNYSLDKFDLENSTKAFKEIKMQIADNLYEDFKEVYNNLHSTEFDLTHSSMGKRALKNICLSYIMASSRTDKDDFVFNAYKTSTNMTDEYAAFHLLVTENNKYKADVKTSFYNKWKGETLVLQKWFSSLAQADDLTINNLVELEKLPEYDKKVPNILRSLVGSFAMNNIVALNDVSGSGFSYFADKILEVDKFNPQIAAGLAKRLNHLNRLEGRRYENLKNQLQRILEQDGLSSDVYEIVKLNLG